MTLGLGVSPPPPQKKKIQMMTFLEGEGVAYILSQ